MKINELVEQLLEQGMTPQQIVDLVTDQVVRLQSDPADDALDVPLGLEVPTEPTAQRDDLVSNPAGTPATTAESPGHDLRSRRIAEVVEELGRPSGSLLFMLSQRSSSPMPSPEVAEQYERILPGFTDRCLAIHESNSKSMRTSLATSDRRMDRGQLFALLFALACLGCGLGFALLGYPAAGATVIGTTLASVVGAFLFGRMRQSRQKQGKLGQRAESGEGVRETDSQQD